MQTSFASSCAWCSVQIKCDLLTFVYSIIFFHQPLCDRSWTTSTRQPSNTWDKPTSTSQPPPRPSWRRRSRITGHRYCETYWRRAGLSQQHFQPHSFPPPPQHHKQQSYVMNGHPVKDESSKHFTIFLTLPVKLTTLVCLQTVTSPQLRTTYTSTEGGNSPHITISVSTQTQCAHQRWYKRRKK